MCVSHDTYGAIRLRALAPRVPQVQSRRVSPVEAARLHDGPELVAALCSQALARRIGTALYDETT
jgi:hypothetical protein